jgi:hypothetical protein
MIYERTTTAKNMGILKYHQTCLISYEIGWPLACLDGLIKPNQTSHQGAKWTSSVSMLKVPVLALLIKTSAVWPWCRRSFQDICRGLDNYSSAYLWLISHDLSHGVSLMKLNIKTKVHWVKLQIHRLWHRKDRNPTETSGCETEEELLISSAVKKHSTV